MLNALGYAFIDAINVLVIGVLVALAMMLPPGRYRPVAGLLLLGTFTGILGLAVVVMLAFDAMRDLLTRIVDSPIFGVLLILTGVVTAIVTLRSGGDTSSPLVDRILTPLRTPSLLTVGIGIVLGVAQSITSVPYLAGLAVLSTSGMPAAERYPGLLAFAAVAVSLPVVAAIGLGIVRHRPRSWVGRLFGKARANQTVVARGAGWLVSVLLIVIGVFRVI